MEHLDYERQSLESAMHAQAIAEISKQEIFCKFTGRNLGEIGQKPRGYDPAEMPEFDKENEQSKAIGEDTRDALRNLQLCGRGIVRSSSLIWEGDD